MTPIFRALLRPVHWCCLQLGAFQSGLAFSRSDDYMHLWYESLVRTRAARAFTKRHPFRGFIISYWRGRMYGLTMLIPGARVTGISDEEQAALQQKKSELQKKLQ